MLTIDKKALEYAQERNGSFIVKTISASGGCCDVPIKDLSIEFLVDFKESSNYKSFEYKGVKVFIEKYLQLEEDILIYQKMKLPFIGSIFGSKGISVKYI
ncbi:hypothetical protein N4T77_13705 [Clostridium sp. CX1]|uniref:DUF779 domain-containing protein n=1 Tax=Clostridium tanneri TaxID=3037988 RepID=A0ABU4JQF3_9CLOT|nr:MULTISPECIES: hypothetical protein [unclassified Clostridium]MCT8977650.1 hypothetical protein [Clostridium sp. CX1]MDW8800387.1 hypothetical protein [Clostridium sp. A1-XYC3]